MNAPSPLPVAEQALAYYEICKAACTSYPEAIADTVRVFGSDASALAHDRFFHDMADARRRFGS